MDSLPLPVIAILSMLPVFTLIVVVHEGGHFWAARFFKVKVEAFSIGFGPVLAGWTDKHGTAWRISALPLGGYVKFLGDANAASSPDREQLRQLRETFEAEHGAGSAAGCFHFKPVWQRAIIVAAGPIANFLLAIAIFAALLMSLERQQIEPVVVGFSEVSAAQDAGLQIGDRIVEIDGAGVDDFNDIPGLLALRAHDTLDVVVMREDRELVFEATIGGVLLENNRVTRPVEVGRLGILAPGDEYRSVTRLGPIAAVGEGAQLTWTSIAMTGRFIAQLAQGKQSFDLILGPVGMFQMAGEGTRSTITASQDGGVGPGGTGLNVVLFLLSLAASISIGIGLINLLPIPMLDGGHLMYYAYEAVAGRPLGEAAQEWGYRIGLVVVLGFMLFVTLNDLRWTGVFGAVLGQSS